MLILNYRQVLGLDKVIPCLGEVHSLLSVNFIIHNLGGKSNENKLSTSYVHSEGQGKQSQVMFVIIPYMQVPCMYKTEHQVSSIHIRYN